ncbi:electron transfer flavoprotein-ubiquinone oxidoreductase [Devosia sp. SL43]|uniref:electron transfer flavoprotein-ubiquinone oxidoreductase n=1 Tax=Devosia sp. SL43 TaxID=2806348 RepID=UPI001F1A2285|nr:electron transfer flavoprotein-ubiquinone oxidoreductase [Devosia sp. SL43]UJW86543.1 electron transfer flavoprotein-ubiquinone oxidoreductase [Devosia sp. SL43]
MAAAEPEVMDYDVVVVGAGPAGLSAAIRLKQRNATLNVVVLEKGSEVGAHVLSGAVLDVSGLDALLPDWRERDAPVEVAVADDQFWLLGPKSGFRIPAWIMPAFMSNHGKYVVSMANLCRWLAQQAEGLGVEIFPGMSASRLVWDGDRIAGVVAGEFGLGPDGRPGPNYEPGVALRGRYVLLGEGARGSLTKQVIAHFGLSEGRSPQKFGLGLKEIWEIDPALHKPGTIVHTIGWPLGADAGGGGFAYHGEKGKVHIGLVVHLDYGNPHLSPYMEFQRFKHHPMLAKLLTGGRRTAYGARVITEGGWQSLPKLVAPGVALLGCAAGMVNVPRIKGNHNAMLSGIAAADAVEDAVAAGRRGDELTDYEAAVRNGAIGDDLRPVRNVKPVWSRWGLWAALVVGGADMWCNALFGFSPLGTLRHRKSDAAATRLANACNLIDYPKPDGTLSFDRLTNVAFSATNHDEGQPSHLRLIDPAVPISVNLPLYAEPAQRYCPAGVYEVLMEQAGPRFQVNAQNCLHCKACDIKDPSQNIVWTVPVGGGGPNYPNM